MTDRSIAALVSLVISLSLGFVGGLLLAFDVQVPDDAKSVLASTGPQLGAAIVSLVFLLRARKAGPAPTDATAAIGREEIGA